MVVLPLVAVDVLVTVLFALACALLIAVILREVAKLVNGLPAIGPSLAGAINGMDAKITGALWAAVHGSLALIGASWHALARLLDTSWHLLENYALGYVQLAELVAKLVYSHSGLSYLVHHAESALHGIEHGVKRLEREWHGIEAKVKRLERDAGHGIDRVARDIATKALSEYRGIDQLITTRIPAEIDAAEAQTAALARFVGAIPGVNYLEWAAGIATAALGAEILNGLKCSSLLSSLNKRGCGLFSGLEDILGLLIDGLILTDLCNVLPEAEKIFAEFEAPLVALISDAANAVCAQPPKGWATPSVTYGSLPPAQTLGSLPA